MIKNHAQIGNVAEILLEYVEHNRTFQSERVMGVPASRYTDPEIWRAEMDLIFKRVPLMLALSCEMPKRGDYKAMRVLGLPILMARNKTGDVNAFLNVCAHRWAPLVSEGRGNCPRFTCPFHGWSYGTDGKLISISDPHKFGDLDKAAHGLRKLPCEERHGLIFVGLTPGMALGLSEYYGELLDDLADAGMEERTLVGSWMVESGNWKIPLTNFFESYHFATAHPKTVAPVAVPNVTHYEGFGPNMRIGFATHSISRLRDVPRAEWGGHEDQGLFNFMRFLFPNVTVSFLRSDMAVFTQTMPGPDPNQSQVLVHYVRKQPPGDDAERAEIASGIQREKDILQAEDIDIGVATQKGLGSGAHDGLLYGRNERGPQFLHEWVDWYLERDPDRPQPVM